LIDPFHIDLINQGLMAINKKQMPLLYQKEIVSIKRKRGSRSNIDGF
jgi:hypothetical protein